MENIFSIETVSLTAGYTKKEIVKELSISVSPGEIVTLIGPNGSGKSTVLKTIASQLSPLSGTVLIDGKPGREMNEKETAKKMSVLLTKKAEPELITCGEVVESGRYPYTGRLGFLSRDDRRISEEAMALTGISYLKDTDFECISDGQRQLVMIARAVCQEPEIMILDEPTSFLDVSHKLELLWILEKLANEKNISVIMSLHEVELAQKVSDRIICIKNGKADRTGTPEEVFSDNYISRLYGIRYGYYNEENGSAELSTSGTAPEIFVIGGGGSAVNVYRKLRRRNIPFAAGIIHTNDREYFTACSLASEVISEKAFEPVSDESVDKAIEVMKKCKGYICCLNHLGTMNIKTGRIIEYAKNNLKNMQSL